MLQGRSLPCCSQLWMTVVAQTEVKEAAGSGFISPAVAGGEEKTAPSAVGPGVSYQ